MLLVVLASVVMPSMSAMGRRSGVMTTSGDVLRFLNDNRRRAIDEGTRRWVRYESGGTTLIAGPDATASDLSFELTGDCEFDVAATTERLPDVVADGLSGEQKTAAWSPEITFYPDGTADDVAFGFHDNGGRERVVEVRRLTGRSTVRGVAASDAVASRDAAAGAGS